MSADDIDIVPIAPQVEGRFMSDFVRDSKQVQQ